MPDFRRTCPVLSSRLGLVRIEGANWIGDVDTLLDEVRFYLVNFQVWFLTENITRGSVVDRDAGMTLRVNGWRIDVERRQEFSDAMRHMEDNRGYARTRCWPTRDRRSVTTAGVTMVPRSADQRVVVSAVHDLTPSTEGLQRPRTS